MSGATVTFPRVVRAEALKARTLRATHVTLVSAFVLTIAISGLLAAQTASDWTTMTAAQRADVDPLESALLGVYLAQIAIGAFGVLVASSEYATGTIVTTLGAVSSRGRALGAKLLVAGTTAAFVGGAAVVASFTVATALLPGDLSIPVDATTLRVVAGNVLAVAAVAMIGTALAVLTRSTAAALGILMALMVLPAIVVAAPELTTYLPARVAQALMLREASPASHLLDPGPALAVLTGYVVAAIGAAYAVLRRRDA